jgi:L-threonylcarbamoyladenylate synthase
METRCLDIRSPAEPTVAAVAEAVAVLRAGEVVGLPTETVYGLAADALRSDAAARVFEAKERPSFDPLIVHIAEPDWLPRVALPDPADAALVHRLASAFWPGPLTLVLPRHPAVPDLVTAGLPTVAVRISAHPVFHAVCEAFGGPLAAPSANRFGRVSPTTGADVVEELGGRIPLVLDAGPTLHGIESTILRVRGGRLTLLRPGPVCAGDLAGFAPVDAAQTPAAEDRPEAPGSLESHYAPATPLRFVSDRQRLAPRAGAKSGLISWDPDVASRGFAAVELWSPRRDLREAAANLFRLLRAFDRLGLDEIVVQAVPAEGLGLAINDRLRRAAARRVA